MVFLSHRLATLLFVASCTANAVGIQGEIQNSAAWTVTGATGKTLVLLTNLTQGKIIGLGTLEGREFHLTIPVTFKPALEPLQACPGVKSSPSEPKTYIAEQLMLFYPTQNAVALLTQADDPIDPTRRAQWMYSDRAATVKGRCTGLNTYYDLTLHVGWNAVMTVSEPSRFLVRNAAESLPYWVITKALTPARTLFPNVFDGK
ncbi:hypothetical protein [Deinococcus alpinitundrae]|uniref:hypothetical protein n=1 Tax=Deinococcus alpinitundrae TaxID=468913 RepID=UPI00137B2D7F|nr:hypothetical protein [Deinococcus alpinitundrae]